MDFDFTEDQEALRDAVRRFVDKDYDFERRKAIVRAGGFDRGVWDGLAGLGLTALAVPEAHGGLGFGAVEAMVVMEELGRGLVMEPIAQGALIAPAMLAQELVLFSRQAESRQADFHVRLLGPAVGGVLIDQSGLVATYFLTIAMLLPSALAILAMRTSGAPAGERRTVNLKSIFEGIEFIWIQRIWFCLWRTIRFSARWQF